MARGEQIESSRGTDQVSHTSKLGATGDLSLIQNAARLISVCREASPISVLLT